MTKNLHNDVTVNIDADGAKTYHVGPQAFQDFLANIFEVDVDEMTDSALTFAYSVFLYHMIRLTHEMQARDLVTVLPDGSHSPQAFWPAGVAIPDCANFNLPITRYDA